MGETPWITYRSSSAVLRKPWNAEKSVQNRCSFWICRSWDSSQIHEARQKRCSFNWFQVFWIKKTLIKGSDSEEKVATCKAKKSLGLGGALTTDPQSNLERGGILDSVELGPLSPTHTWNEENGTGTWTQWNLDQWTRVPLKLGMRSLRVALGLWVELRPLNQSPTQTWNP